MPKRILNIHLYRESDQLILRLVDMYPSELPVKKTDGMTYVYHVNHDMDDIGDSLEWNWSQLNHFAPELNFFDEDLLGFAPQYSHLVYSVDENFSPLDAFSDVASKRFTYRLVRVTLPQTNQQTLLKILVGLDAFIRDYQIAIGNRYDVFINFHTSVPETVKTLEDVKKIYTQQSHHTDDQPQFSRFVVKWLISELSDQTIIDTLNNLLASDQPSLTQVLRKKLYGESPNDCFVRQNCGFYKDDKAMAALLDRNIICASAIDTLRKQLRTQSITKNKRNESMTIEYWYERFAWVRRNLWEDMIYSVIGEIAKDGGMYTKEYTELRLLSEATIKTNNHGEMILHYDDSPTYKKCYAKGQQYYNELENELRKAVDLMGLHFLPDQDFHTGKVTFDRQSTEYLQNCGFHITKEYCESLVHTPHFYRLFNGVETQSETAKPSLQYASNNKP